MIKHKINKYINKMYINPKYLYANKIFHYISNDTFDTLNNKSNFLLMDGGSSIKYNDCNSIIAFLQEKCNSIANVTKNKYLVILYGPPGSGKSFARNIASNIIKTNYDEINSEEEILKDFIDTGIDELTYDIVEPTSNKQVRTLLIENLKTQLKINPENTIDPNISNEIKNDPFLLKKLVSSSFEIYKNNRKDSLSELLYFFAISINKNIFLELASPQMEYLNRILSLITYYQYIPIFIYSFVNQSSILCNRSINRGIQEGRFLECKNGHGIENAMKNCLTYYEDMKQIIRKYNKYYILQYNANFDKETLDQIKVNNFNNLENYKLEYEFVKQKIENNKNMEAHYIYRILDYDKKVILDFDSTY